MTSGVNIPVGATDKASSTIDRIRDKFERLGAKGAALDIGKGMAMGAGIASFNLLAAAAELAVRGIGETLSAASNLNESMNKARVVFKDSFDQIEAFAKSGPRAIGMTAQAAYEATGTFGNLFTALGLSTGASADMSINAVKLAADLASFNNIKPELALEKLRAGLVGESEPLRTLGVNINEAAVAAKAMEMGLAKTKGELTDSAKVQARYALIVEQTSNAQGDFARTSDGLANKQRIMDAKIGDLAAKIGGYLAPVMSSLIDVGLALADTFGQIVDIVGPVLGPVLTWLAGVIGQLAGIIGPFVMQGLKLMAEAFKVLVEAVLTAGQALMTVAAAIPGPWQDGANAVNASLQSIKDSLNSASDSGEDAAKAFGSDTAGALASTAPQIEAGAEAAMAGFPAAASSAGAKAVTATKRTLSQIVGAIRDSKDDFVSAWKGAIEAGNREQEIGNEISANLADQRVQKAIIASKKSTAAEKAEARTRLANLQAEHASLLAEQSTYGTLAVQMARTKALLQSQAMADGLKSGDPDVRAYWQTVYNATLSKLTSLATATNEQGRSASRAYAHGVRDKDALTEVSTAAGKVSARVRGEFYTTVDAHAKGWGTHATKTFASGVKSPDAIAAVIAALNRVIDTISDFFAGMSPPRKGPLHEIDRWGSNVGRTWAKNFALGAAQTAAPAPGRLMVQPVALSAVVGQNRGGRGTLAAAAAPGPGVTVVIERFYGDSTGVQQLSRELAQTVRLQQVKGLN